MIAKPDLSGTKAPFGAASPIPASQESIILASWERSRKAGLTTDMTPDFSGTSSTNVRNLLEESRQLAHLAYPVLQALHEQIANTHSMVLLTDGAGRILHSLGDDTFLERAERVALKPGVDWSELAKGTNAIGTAIAQAQPVVVHGEQHYLEVNRFLTCSSTPIFSPEGKIIGVLDVSGDACNYYHHTIALARMSAQIIENQLFTETFQDAVKLHFHSRPEFIGTLFEGLVSFAPGGRFLAANRGALFQLGLDVTSLQRHTISSLFGISMDELMDHCRSSTPEMLSLSLHNGVTVRAKAEMRVMKLWQVPADTSGTAIAPPCGAQLEPAQPAGQPASRTNVQPALSGHRRSPGQCGGAETAPHSRPRNSDHDLRRNRRRQGVAGQGGPQRFAPGSQPLHRRELRLHSRKPDRIGALRL